MHKFNPHILSLVYCNTFSGSAYELVLNLTSGIVFARYKKASHRGAAEAMGIRCFLISCKKNDQRFPDDNRAYVSHQCVHVFHINAMNIIV